MWLVPPQGIIAALGGSHGLLQRPLHGAAMFRGARTIYNVRALTAQFFCAFTACTAVATLAMPPVDWPSLASGGGGTPCACVSQTGHPLSSQFSQHVARNSGILERNSTIHSTYKHLRTVLRCITCSRLCLAGCKHPYRVRKKGVPAPCNGLPLKCGISSLN